MLQNMSLLEFLRELLTNMTLRDSFARDPQATLRQVGLDKLSPADVHDALILNQDNMATPQGRQSDAPDHHPVHAPAPGASQEYGSDGEGHEVAVEQLRSFVTNNFVDNRSTTVDNSMHQRVDTHGGGFDQNIDVHSALASGDGATSVGGNVDHSAIVAGHDNQVGNGNVHGAGDVVGSHNQALTGSHDTSSFGSGSASGSDIAGGVRLGDGAAFGSGGSAAVDNSDRSLHEVANDYDNQSVRTSSIDLGDHSGHDVGEAGAETGGGHPSWHETAADHQPAEVSAHLDPTHLPV